jgi:TPR repeat protein
MYGSCYFVGDGVDQDYDKAEFWFRKAAAQGDSDAKRMLELMYDTPKVKTEAVEVL